jgi:hypothetical protein
VVVVLLLVGCIGIDCIVERGFWDTEWSKEDKAHYTKIMLSAKILWRQQINIEFVIKLNNNTRNR